MTDTSVVGKWYDQNAILEHNRLMTSCIEYSITMRVIKQCLLELATSSGKPIRILDLGGGTGRYGLAPFLFHFSSEWQTHLLTRISGRTG